MTRHHGYALVERRPLSGDFMLDHDVVIVEQLMPDGSVRGPLAQPNGQARTRASKTYDAGTVRHIFRTMPKPAARRAVWQQTTPVRAPVAPRTRRTGLGGISLAALVATDRHRVTTIRKGQTPGKTISRMETRP
jgi:hypothetical protein